MAHTIYRVEQKEDPGKGPFWGAGCGGKSWGAGMWWDGPSSYLDCRGEKPPGVNPVMGCFEPSQIDRWFPPHWRRQWVEKLDLLVFKVPDEAVVLGTVQAIFERPPEPLAVLLLDTPVEALPLAA